jgi:MFS transporter, ACDE family, multidrug resistance protein
VSAPGNAPAGIAASSTAGTLAGRTASPFRQPKAVWAVTFACVISFMGIGLVDPILPALRDKLNATPSQVELLFTSYPGRLRLIPPRLLVPQAFPCR